MKKGLLSILASALLVVGCQNYDDQFNNLESQISALATTVAGLSQVQSELAQLTSNVSNIQAALADIPSSAEINSSINEGLAGVIDDIAELETSLDNVVSADDLTTVSDAISDVADDVSDILSSNNVYDQKLLITNQAELDIAIGLGGKIALINNDVEIILNDEMNRADLDSIAARITAVVGGFEYDGDLEDYESNGLVFSKLKSVSQQLKWETRDDISFPALTSVGSLDIVTGDSELITSASFPVLTKLPYVSTSTDGGTTTQANTIDLEDSASLTMSALIRYTGAATASQRGTKAAAGTATTAANALTIILNDDDATTFDLAALTTEDADDSDSDVALALTLTGPRSVTLANYAQGVLTAADATTVVLPDYEWNASTALASVETLRVHKVATSVDVSGFSNLEILDLRNAAYETKNPTTIAISANGNTNVENINLDGYFASFTATGATSLDTIVTAGEIGTFEITTSKIAELTLGHKAWRTLAGTPVATLQLTGNTKLTSITADSLDDVNVMEIVDNDKLETISLAGLTSTSTKAAASATAGTPAVAPVIGVLIYGNAKLTSTYQTASAVGALTTVAEAVTFDQAPASLVTWIKAAKAVWGTTGFGAQGQSSKADGTIYIETDEYTSVAADGDETEVSSAYVVANLYGATTSNGATGTYAKRSFNLGKTDGAITATIDGAIVPSTNGTLQGTLGATVARWITESAVLLADKGISATSATTGGAAGTVTIGTGSLTTGDLITLSVGSVNVTQNGWVTTPTYAFVVPADYDSSNSTSNTTLANLIEDQILQGSSNVGTATATAYAGTATTVLGGATQALKTANTSDAIIELEEIGNGNSLNGAAITVTVKHKPAATSVASWTALSLVEKEAAAVTTTNTLAGLGIEINGTASTADDVMEATDVILTLTSTDIGTLSTIGQPLDGVAGAIGDITSFVAGSVTLTTFIANEVHSAGDQDDLKAALGLGADILTAATTAAIAAGKVALATDQCVLESSLTAFGQDGVTNTSPGAGSTPDKISKLAAGV